MILAFTILALLGLLFISFRNAILLKVDKDNLKERLQSEINAEKRNQEIDLVVDRERKQLDEWMHP